MNKSVLILEDNYKTLEALEKIVKNLSKEIEIYKVQTYEEASQTVFLYKIDLFIIDIILSTQKPGDTSGLQFAQTVRKMEDYKFTPIIFVTALSDPQLYAFKQLHSYGYLEKPFSLNKAEKLIQEALEFDLKHHKKEDIYLRKDGIWYSISLEDVVYVEVSNHLITINFEDDKLDIPYITIKQFMEKAGNGFLQISRSTAVNKNFIQYIDLANRYIRLKDKHRRMLEVGPVFSKKIRRKLLYAPKN